MQPEKYSGSPARTEARIYNWANAFFFAIAILGGGGLLVWTTIGWAKSGKWEPMLVVHAVVYSGLDLHSTGWKGIDQLVVWLIEQSLSSILFLVGVGCGFLCLLAAHDAEKRDREAEVRWRQDQYRLARLTTTEREDD